MVAVTDAEALRDKALKHLWMHNRGWDHLAERGGPQIISEGQGIRVTDSEGKSWIDVNGGYASVNVGYGRHEIAEAAYEQMLKLPYFPEGTTTEPAIRLADRLAEAAPGDLSRVFLSSGGSEANETALRITHAYHRRRGEEGRSKVIALRDGYHGATGGVEWLGVHEGAMTGDYGPKPSGVLSVPAPDPYRCEVGGETPEECAVRCAGALEELVKSEGPETISAFIMEPVMGRLMGLALSTDYMALVRDTCERYGIVMIADEIVTGFGRTGKMFGADHWGFAPDIMCVAKGISSSYLPLGATIVSEKIAEPFGGSDTYLRHVFTSAGHPVVAAAALKNMEIIESEGLVENAAIMGAELLARLEELMSDHVIIGTVRGRGLLMGGELVSDRRTKAYFDPEVDVAGRLNKRFEAHGLIMNANPRRFKVSPPLCVNQADIDEIIHAIDLSLWEVEGELGMNTTV